jgi:hypothetical protein
MCPFARGTPQALARFARHPGQAAEALYLEHVSLTLNPRMPLYATGSLAGKLAADTNDHSAAERLFDERLSAAVWAVYRVRRVYHAKGRADRSIEHVRTGSRTEMMSALEVTAEALGCRLELDAQGILRFYARRREADVYPTAEEMYVAGPADAAPKARPSFEAVWSRIA